MQLSLFHGATRLLETSIRETDEHAMNPFPKTKDEWIALPLFPFKAWVVIAFPFYFFVGGYALGQYGRYGTGEFGMMAMPGYMVSVPVLSLGALIQCNFSERGEAAKTALYALAGITLFLSFCLFQ
jgi:hypothetical protein